MDIANYRFTGEGLRRQYDLPVRHCLYHKDGTFYEKLVQFPGAICDPQGYVQFNSEAEYERDPRLSIGKKVNVPPWTLSSPEVSQVPEE